MQYKKEFLGEFIGTLMMVLFGCGSVAGSVLFASHQGLLQIALVWGMESAWQSMRPVICLVPI